jgi:hypothetical protein
MNLKYLLLVFLSLSLSQSFGQVQNKTSSSARQRISLQGRWQFSLDTSNVGIKDKWFASAFSETVSLPGTTDLFKKGHLNIDSTTMHLSRVYRYEGPAWYRRNITIPKGFQKKHIMLFLERTKSSSIWVDHVLVGTSKILQSAQQFDVSKYLSPGKHSISIRIDNTLKLTPYGNVHIYSDDTQTNWNGILGEMFIEASAPVFINDLQVDPNIQRKEIDVKLGIQGKLALKNVTVDLSVERTLNGKTQALKSVRFVKAAAKVIHLSYNLGDTESLWDEYEQPIYKLTAHITSGNQKDDQSVNFGMRKFATKGTQFTINDRVTFLRGKHDAGVFPLTGYPPMDVKAWLRVFRIAKSYGINHYRFHSWCPPEAAFTAADQIGIYLQTELPFWGGLDSDAVAASLRAEGIAMLKSYANHPSFVMLSHGNEIWGGHDRIEKNIIALKQYDSRPLYTMGSNVNIGYHPLQKSSDFFIGARVPSKGDTILGHARLSHAFADAKGGGALNTLMPATLINFSYAVAHMPVPIISHEIGQYQIYPDYKEIDKYTGVLQARNLEVFRKRLEKAGMLDQDLDFQKASGAWAALCYKAEMEAAIRTKGFGGFQLLDLQDYPGQGTALVGILDAFMDSKHVVSQKEWLQSCNDVVLLLEFPKYVYTNKEAFQAKLEVANYSNKDLNQEVRWTLTTDKGAVVSKGSIVAKLMEKGTLFNIDDLNVSLSEITTPQRLNVNVSLSDGSYDNTYPIWVYPQTTERMDLGDISIATKLDDGVFAKLEKGEKVLLLPQTADVSSKSLPGLFPPEFWNWGMFKGISESVKKPVSPGTLGLLADPNHPAFKLFPTDSHTNWQWFSMIKASNAIILDETDQAYRPILQVIDNLERDHKLGLIFEFKVGQGKLLVCSAQLNQLMEKPEAKQLYKSLVEYMKSDAFRPAYNISKQSLQRIL